MWRGTSEVQVLEKDPMDNLQAAMFMCPGVDVVWDAVGGPLEMGIVFSKLQISTWRLDCLTVLLRS